MSREQFDVVGDPAKHDSTAMDSDEPDDPARTIDLLTEENQRLHREYEQLRKRTARRRWRKIALVLLALASVDSLLAIYFFPAMQELLLTLGAAGLFLVLFLVALQSEWTTDVDERVFGVLTQNCAVLAAELGLGVTHVYVPKTDDTSARLFAPADPDFELQALAGRDGDVTLSGDERFRELSLTPTGVPLFYRFEEMLPGPLPSDAGTLAGALCEAVVDDFEVAAEAHPVVDTHDGRATVSFDETAYGPVDQFDHPVVSFVGVGLAIGLETPVVLESVTQSDEGKYEVVYRWNVS